MSYDNKSNRFELIRGYEISLRNNIIYMSVIPLVKTSIKNGWNR